MSDVKEMIKDKAGAILSNLMSQGGEYGEIFYERSRTTRMELEDRKIDRILHGHDEGVGIRLLKNGRTYYGYTNDPTFENLMHIAKTLARGEGYGPVAVGKRYLEGWTPVVVDPDAVDLRFRAEILKRADEKARSYGDRIKQVLSVLMDRTREILIVNTLGEMAEDVQKRIVFYVEVVASDGHTLQKGYESIGGRKGFEIFDEVPPEVVAQRAAERAILMLSAKPAPAGTFTVVLSSQAGGTMIHEAVGHGLEADLVQKGLSVYSGKLGRKVASDLVTVVDDATLPDRNGSFTVDDEGVPAQRKVLIEKGYLVGYMYDRLRAMKEGRESTGNGRRQSYAHVPIVRMTNTFIEKGKDNPEDIIRDTKRGVYVVKMGGGEVNTVTGDFVFEIMEGYMIENGEITYPIRGATLIGNGPKALQDIDAVGNDLGWAIGTCGKDGQGVPVTDAQPTVRIRQLTLGGSQVR
ncbi:MAG: TldD/PmbA family protein [Aquificota bacterium]|nr:TldD/PmbA family protein [Aquificota bacterium]